MMGLFDTTSLNTDNIYFLLARLALFKSNKSEYDDRWKQITALKDLKFVLEVIISTRKV
mgnify:CR=1 FL=1